CKGRPTWPSCSSRLATSRPQRSWPRRPSRACGRAACSAVPDRASSPTIRNSRAARPWGSGWGAGRGRSRSEPSTSLWPTRRAVVSQGCRPIGPHMVITRGEENVIQELGGKTPAVQLQHLWQELEPGDQELIQQGCLHIGRVINEYQGEFQRGDFLIRNLVEL